MAFPRVEHGENFEQNREPVRGILKISFFLHGLFRLLDRSRSSVTAGALLAPQACQRPAS